MKHYDFDKFDHENYRKVRSERRNNKFNCDMRYTHRSWVFEQARKRYGSESISNKELFAKLCLFERTIYRTNNNLKG